jgi:hypothetical protein
MVQALHKSTDGITELIEGRRYKRTTRHCEYCAEMATRIVDVMVDGELFEFYLLCDSKPCLDSLITDVI